MIRVLFILIFGILHQYSIAQPHIDGEIEIDMKLGIIKCDFTLSQLPNLKDYSVLLNKGMNVKYFRDVENNIIDYSGHFNGETNGEAIAYKILDTGDSLPPKFKLSYIGAFPVYNNEYNSFDYKGVIAFTETTLRATEQTKWYPVIYDVINDRLINSYSYKLKIQISGGNTIFVNGSPPKEGKLSHFESKKPYPLLIFTGTYDYIESGGDFILNSGITKQKAKDVFKNIEIIKRQLSTSLEKEFTDHIYLINHRALNKRKEGSSWGFNTYPTFAFTGLNFNELVNDQGEFSKNNYKYFGHEFGHNYFGNNVMGGDLTWFWLESFPEYLSYTIAEDICGKEYLKEVLLYQVEKIAEEEFIPLDEVTEKGEVNEKYRYILGPLLLQCFEDTFGQATTFDTLQLILKYAETENLTIQHWENAAIQSGVSKVDYKKFKNQFISNTQFKDNIIKEIISNYN